MINKPLVTRYEGNPILTRHDIPYAVETVHNAAACKLNGQYILLFRSHLRNGRSIIGIARSDDGYEFQSDPEPFMVPAG
ncbi:MAG TPA: glycosidase, partial [Gammaproteobacteria bacterium]